MNLKVCLMNYTNNRIRTNGGLIADEGWINGGLVVDEGWINGGLVVD